MRVLLFDIDTLRADHMGCYGYGRNTTPVMDEIAKEGVRFDDYYCPNAPCLPSRASMISGQYGIHNGIVGHGGTAADMRRREPPEALRMTCLRTDCSCSLEEPECIRFPSLPLQNVTVHGGSIPVSMNVTT